MGCFLLCASQTSTLCIECLLETARRRLPWEQSAARTFWVKDSPLYAVYCPKYNCCLFFLKVFLIFLVMLKGRKTQPTQIKSSDYVFLNKLSFEIQICHIFHTVRLILCLNGAWERGFLLGKEMCVPYCVLQ